MSSFIPALLNLIASVLEAFFVSAKNSSIGGGGGPTDDTFHHADQDRLSDEEKNSVLKAAYDFFEIEPEEATREIIKKTWKTLSLLHHPDRNGNSPSSIEMMQKLNTYYKVLEKEFDRKEGMDIRMDIVDEVGNESDQNDANETHEHVHRAQDDHNECQSNIPKANKNKKQRRRRKEKQRSRTRKQTYDSRKTEEHRRMEEEMRREWQEIKRQKKELQRKKKALRKESKTQSNREDLHTKEGRDRAHKAWADAVNKVEEQKQYAAKSSSKNTDTSYCASTQDGDNHSGNTSLHDIDDHQPAIQAGRAADKQEGKASFFPEPIPTKPLNLVMEYCTTDLAIALRLGLTEVAIDTFQDELAGVLKSELRWATFSGKNPEPYISRGIHTFLVRSIDADENTLLHYAVYYENVDMIRFIAHVARRCSTFPEVILKMNCRGENAAQYAKCCIRDSSIPDVVITLTDSAETEIEDKLILPSLKKTARRLWGITKEVSIMQTTNTIISFVVGKQLFNCGTLMTISICSLVQGTQPDGEYEGEHGDTVAFLFASHLTWLFLAALYGIVWKNLPGELFFLLIPFGIMLCCAEKKTAQGLNWTRVLLLPFASALYILKFLSGVLGGISSCVSIPKLVRQNHLERCFFLAIFYISFSCAKYGIVNHW